MSEILILRHKLVKIQNNTVTWGRTGQAKTNFKAMYILSYTFY